MEFTAEFAVLMGACLGGFKTGFCHLPDREVYEW